MISPPQTIYDQCSEQEDNASYNHCAVRTSRQREQVDVRFKGRLPEPKPPPDASALRPDLSGFAEGALRPPRLLVLCR